jgi:(4-(4-[2-(gamma-L-glutamylamino)ethyl]phenoxymethyl)furan-2-yl)methanamine synthase
LVEVLGVDIGGANTKAAFLTVNNGKVQTVKVASEYFPIWKNPEKLTCVLLELKDKVGAVKLDALAVTMTAELSDAYQTKREGVRHILGCVKKAFPDVPIYVLNSGSELDSMDAALEQPIYVASANWAATGWLVAQHIKNCVVLDVGSTTTSIIPIIKGKVAAEGKTDLDKLMCGELVYTGSLRTNVAAIVQSFPIAIRGELVTVASELFAQSGDVHLILGNISEKEYTCETADGRGKTRFEAMARLARVVCADTDMLSEREIVELAKIFYALQLQQISRSLARVCSNVDTYAGGRVVVVTGLGKDFLARKTAEKNGADEIIDLAALVQEEAVLATPAFAVALMAAKSLEGENNH